MVAGSSAVFRRTAAAPMGLLEKSAAYSASSHAIKRLVAYSWTAGAAKLRADSGRYLAGSRPHTHRGSCHQEVIATRQRAIALSASSAKMETTKTAIKTITPNCDL